VVPETAWEIAVLRNGQVRERRSDDACPDPCGAHRACWIEEAHITELTGLLREGPGGDQLKGWPKTMRIFARRERPHPGAQLSLFEAADGWRHSLWVTNLPATTKAGAASAPTLTPRTASTPASRTSSAPARTPASVIFGRLLAFPASWARSCAWGQTAKSGRNLETGTLRRSLTRHNILSDGNF
jgi:hypothetical protein